MRGLSYLIAKSTVVVWVLPPPVPVITSVVVPAFALGFALTVSVVALVELEGLNVAVVLGSRPLTENVTALLKPLTLLTTEIV